MMLRTTFVCALVPLVASLGSLLGAEPHSCEANATSTGLSSPVIVGGVGDSGSKWVLLSVPCATNTQNALTHSLTTPCNSAQREGFETSLSCLAFGCAPPLAKLAMTTVRRQRGAICCTHPLPPCVFFSSSGIQRATHRVLYRRGGIFSHVDGATGPRLLGPTNRSSPPSSAYDAFPSDPLFFSPDLAARRGSPTLWAWDPRGAAAPGSPADKRGRSFDPYEAWVRAVVRHASFAPSSADAEALCGAVAKSWACAGSRSSASNRADPDLRRILDPFPAPEAWGFKGGVGRAALLLAHPRRKRGGCHRVAPRAASEA